MASSTDSQSKASFVVHCDASTSTTSKMKGKGIIIGKGLDPRFDITEIAKPYALELLKLREAGVEVILKEKGDLKLRVRTLESERAFQRVAALQKTIGSAVAAGSLVNLATILYLNSIRVPALAAYAFCAFFGLQVLIGVIKVKKFDERERLITGTT